MVRSKFWKHLILISFQIISLPSLSFTQEPVIKNYLIKQRKTLLDEFRKEIIKIAEGIYVAVGYGASNSVLIEGTDGLIIIDTMLSTEAVENVLAAFRNITNKPIKVIIFTHSHSDHISGTTIFARESSPEIYAGSAGNDGLTGYDKLVDILGKRSKRQFGSDLPLAEKIAGIAPVYRPTGGSGKGKLKATHSIKAQRKKLTIAGIELEIVVAPGETNDHIYVWLPNSKVLICGDNYYFSFPNLYAIRGTQYRDISEWVNSLNKILKEEAEYLISGHARPIFGKENVRKVLTDYRDAIKYVFDHTLQGMNRGLTADELAHSVKLPEALANKDYLQEFYGVIAWSVRSIYSGYLGWFDGNPTNLFPLSPVEEARRIVELSGSKEKLSLKIKEAIATGDFQWACQLADYILAIEPESKEIRSLKAEALIALADKQISSNARHYYLSTAFELKEQSN